MDIHSHPETHDGHKQSDLELNCPEVQSAQITHSFCKHIDQFLFSIITSLVIKFLIDCIMVMFKIQIAIFLFIFYLLDLFSLELFSLMVDHWLEKTCLLPREFIILRDLLSFSKTLD